MSIRLRVISLGAGVQSTTMALMAADGEIGPKPDCAIFADTQDEGDATYRHLAVLRSMLNFPVYVVTRGKLSDALFAGDNSARFPAFVKAGGMAKRQCTREFKIREIRKEVRRLLGREGRAYIAPGSVEQWIGISLNEADRMKPADVRFSIHRFPLIERRMTRVDCEAWLRARGHSIPPKSACVQCAYKADADWQGMKDTAPDDFERACGIDDRLRLPDQVKRFSGELYLHRSCTALRDVEFRPKPRLDKWFQPDMWANECEGMCGV